MRIGLDTSVLLRLLLGEPAEQAATALAFVKESWLAGRRVVVSDIVVSEAAGYADVRMERKGCDNYWHGFATKDGQPVRIVVSPQGEVHEEGFSIIAKPYRADSLAAALQRAIADARQSAAQSRDRA